MTYVLSIDPGVSNGFAVGSFSDGEPYTLFEAWQVEGGVKALVQWVDEHVYDPFGIFADGVSMPGFNFLEVCSEKFVPLGGKGFAQTLGSTEPLRGEGALIALGVMPDYPDPRWRRPNSMYLYGGKNLAEKKKRARQFLKDTGNYVTGKDVGCKDSNDAMSATLHGISYTAQVLKHEPTYRLISDWVEQNPVD